MKTYTAGTLSGNIYSTGEPVHNVLARRIRRISAKEQGIFFPTTQELKRVIGSLGDRVVYLGY